MAVNSSRTNRQSDKIRISRREFLKNSTGILLAAAPFSSLHNAVAVQSSCFFTIVLLPDTQYYSRSYPAIFTSQTQWIADHRDEHRIKYVLHKGDITNDNTADQWNNARVAMRVLDSCVPYTVAPGNHDLPGNGESRDTTLFNQYFPVSRYQNMPTFGGAYEQGKLDNSFHLFSVEGTDWLILALEFGPRDEVLAWANQVVADYPNRRVIVVTHCYMYSDDTRVGLGDKWNPRLYGVGADANDGEEMWDKFVKLHSNISFVFSGHILNDGKGKLVSTAGNGNKVYQMLANYQTGVYGSANGGNGYLRLVKFDLSRNRVSVKTYSPYLDKYLTDAQNQFEFENVFVSSLSHR